MTAPSHRFAILRLAAQTAAAAAILLLSPSAGAQATAPPAGGVKPSESKYHLVRSVSGSKGTQQGGRYIIEDPRTIFYIPDDRQVVVYFELEGPLGQHHLEGYWKNPEGKVAAINDFQYEATEKRFGAYWTLLVAESAPTGLWTLEAHVDGEVVGTHTFQIVAAPRPANAIPARRILSPAETYQKALASSVFVRALDSKGQPAGTGSGFVLAEGQVLTAFQVIDGAGHLSVALPDGRRVETDQLLAWNRRQDWAILKVDTGKAPALPRAQPNSWNVGGRCYTLDSSAEGGRVIVETTIIGTNTWAGAGERLNVSSVVGPAAAGAALVNEYSGVVGIVGGSLIPGARSLDAGMVAWYSEAVVNFGGPLRGGLAVPITLVPKPSTDAKSTTLDELRGTGQFILPMTARGNVLYGTLAKSIDRKGPIARPVDQKSVFSRRDPTVGVFVSWEPKSKIKSTDSLRVYDLDNRVRIESKAARTELRPGQPSFTFTEIPTADLPPGIYRLDILLGDEVAWRMFFRITE
jgi:S1-C subfamily serine protease